MRKIKSLQPQVICAPERRHNALRMIENTEPGIVRSSKKRSRPNAMELSGSVTCLFFCLSSGLRIGHSEVKQNCGVIEYSKRHSSFLRSDEEKTNNQKETNNNIETANNADADLTANFCCGSLHIVPITFSSGKTSVESILFCDIGARLFFIDKDIRTN